MRARRDVADAEVAKSNQLVWRQKLAMARERLGDLFLRTGKPGLARDEYRAVVVLFQALSESDPTNIEAGADHSRTLYSLALAEERLDDKVAAAGHFKTSLAIRDKRVRDKPEGVALKDLMATQARNRLTREALDTAETVLKQFSSDPSSLVDVACCFAICSGVMPADAAGKEATERHATRAVEILKKAMELGYRDIVNLETEPDLDAVRVYICFQRCIPGEMGWRIGQQD